MGEGDRLHFSTIDSYIRIMSRGFVKEGDQEEMPIIPPRAILPEGMTNYVTEEGLAALHREKGELEAEKASLQASDEDQRVPIRVIDIKLSMLQERIDTAEVTPAPAGEPTEVRFGLVVEYRMGEAAQTHRFRIVGVDEADVSQGKIAFSAPIARAMLGASKGAVIDFDLGGEKRKVTIIDIIV